ncbi:hypothetical protein [Caldovatus aquaticus]|uniref:Uncharacterized protein n=1 Tax=Caldovatus aquaticus TaxID=2865671 RepID=A0ABS7F0W7_9PROT|nr:hypothetical protein [Caldovatus aquaticus]MBW8269253.1 hypothetical protein [Caldovatus aquaticus]
MVLPSLPGMRTVGMGMAGLAAAGGAFAAGLVLGAALGAAGACGAWAACRMMRRRNRWRDEDRIEGAPGGTAHAPGGDSPHLPIGEAPVV